MAVSLPFAVLNDRSVVYDDLPRMSTASARRFALRGRFLFGFFFRR
jgi:hypothetical protein